MGNAPSNPHSGGKGEKTGFFKKGRRFTRSHSENVGTGPAMPPSPAEPRVPPANQAMNVRDGGSAGDGAHLTTSSGAGHSTAITEVAEIAKPVPPPAKLGLETMDFINVHRKEYVGRIELLRGATEGLAKQDETDLLIVYLRQRGVYKGKRDSALAALNRCGISLEELEKETKPQPSYRRHYHCWLSRPIPKPRPEGFEYKRLLVYEDPGEELTRDDNIVLDVIKCLTTVIGGDIQIR